MDEEYAIDNLVVAHSPKRGRELEISPHLVKTSAEKRLRKKSHSPTDKDRTRGRYACLGHRMKHKRCPLDCPERRPKPGQEMTEASLVQVKKEVAVVIKPRVSRNVNGAKRHFLQLEDRGHVAQVSAQVAVPSEKETPKWDSVEWEGLGCFDSEHVCPKETESWMDLKSSSHWEESKSQVLPSEDAKPMDDLTRYEEDEIIDSWLNDEGFGHSTGDDESGPERNDRREGNVSETSSERESSSQTSNVDQVMETLPKILVTRDMLERWLQEPYFNSLVRGCFVRVKIGEYKENPVFRIALIHEVHDNIFGNNLNQTNKLLSLQVGDASNVFPIAAISDQPPTESDLRTWLGEMEKSHLVLNATEVQQKEEMVRILTIKYPGGLQDVEPMINEPVWNC